MATAKTRTLIDIGRGTRRLLEAHRSPAAPSFDKVLRLILRDRLRHRMADLGLNPGSLDDALDAYEQGDLTAVELETLFPGVFDFPDDDEETEDCEDA